MELGKKDDALNVFIDDEGFIHMDSLPIYSFDCNDGKTELGTIVLFWENHKGKNQIFIVNEDQTISPSEKKEHVLGWAP